MVPSPPLPSAVDSMLRFRYVTAAAKPVPWQTVRAVDINRFRQGTPDLDVLKKLTCAVADFTVEPLANAMLHGGAVNATSKASDASAGLSAPTSVELLQLLQALQLALQFTLHSQKVMATTALQPLKARVADLEAGRAQLEQSAVRREKEVASYKEQLQQAERSGGVPSMQLRIDQLEAALSAARSEASAAKTEASAARTIGADEAGKKASDEVAALKTALAARDKELALERARLHAAITRLNGGVAPATTGGGSSTTPPVPVTEDVESWLLGQVVSRPSGVGAAATKPSAVQKSSSKRLTKEVGDEASDRSRRREERHRHRSSHCHRRSTSGCCGHRHAAPAPVAAAPAAASSSSHFDVAAMVALVHALQPQQQQQQQQPPTHTVPVSSEAKAVGAREGVQVTALRADLNDALQRLDAMADDISHLAANHDAVAARFEQQRRDIRADIAKAVTDAVASQAPPPPDAAVATSGNVPDAVATADLREAVARGERAAGVNKIRINDLETALGERLDAITGKLDRLASDLRSKVAAVGESAEEARRESAAAMRAVERRIDGLSERQDAQAYVAQSQRQQQPVSIRSQSPAVGAASVSLPPPENALDDDPMSAGMPPAAPGQGMGSKQQSPIMGATASKASSVANAGAAAAAGKPPLAATNGVVDSRPASAATSHPASSRPGSAGAVAGLPDKPVEAGGGGSRYGTAGGFFDDSDDADPNACPHCAQQFDDVLAHAKECNYRPETCRYCGSRYSVNAKELHLATCGDYALEKEREAAAAKASHDARMEQQRPSPLAGSAGGGGSRQGSATFNPSPSNAGDLETSLTQPASTKAPPPTPAQPRETKMPELKSLNAELERLLAEEEEAERKKAAAASAAAASA